MLCIACVQCMLMYLYFHCHFGPRRLELLPDYRLANKVCMQRVHTHTGTGAVVFPRHLNSRGHSPHHFARGFQAPAQIHCALPLIAAAARRVRRHQVSSVACRYTQVFAVLQHGDYTEPHLLGRAHVRLAGSSARDSGRIPDVLGKLASV